MGGCYTSIVSPEGVLLCEPLEEGEGMVLAELDFSLITKRKRMMDSVGHYSRPELLSLVIDRAAHAPVSGRSQNVAHEAGVLAHEPIAATVADGEHEAARSLLA